MYNEQHSQEKNLSPLKKYNYLHYIIVGTSASLLSLIFMLLALTLPTNKSKFAGTIDRKATKSDYEKMTDSFENTFN